MIDCIRCRLGGRKLTIAVLLAVMAAVTIFAPTPALASEADLAIPDLHAGHFNIAGRTISAWNLLFYGALVICGTLGISLYLRRQIHKLPAHRSMLAVADVIYETCKTYLKQQGKFLLMLFALIAIAMSVYLLGFGHEETPGEAKMPGTSIQAVTSSDPTRTAAAAAPTPTHVSGGAATEKLSPIVTLILVLLFSIVGMGGSYWVAWYGIRVNTYANCRTAFASLRGQPWDVVNIPLRAGMSVGLFLISLELVMMVIILLFVPRQIVGYCFLGFAIGESLGASALRIAGGIFTKIADIGSDLMKIVFKVKEDDPRNPGVIADCTGDNAGDSVGPTADGFETYGVTGVALIAFITLAVTETAVRAALGLGANSNFGLFNYTTHTTNFLDLQVKLIVWIFAMRFLMDFMSGVSYFINQAISERQYRGLRDFNFEAPLTRLIWIASILCISTSFLMSGLLLSDLSVTVQGQPPLKLGGLWW